MLTFAQSLTIVRRSIKAVAGTNVTDIDPEDTLEKAGIPDADVGLRMVKRLACLSGEFGVPKFDHELDFNALSAIGISSTVGDFADTIQANAKARKGKEG